MFRTALLCAFVAYASAQSYGCSPSSYCTSQGYARVDVLGCQYFCYLDTEPPTGSLVRSEFHAAFDDWRKGAPVCDLNCYLDAHRRILTGACDSEIIGGYNILAFLDGDSTSVSIEDVDGWFDQILSIEPIEGVVVSADTFQTYWHALYAQIADPTCPGL